MKILKWIVYVTALTALLSTWGYVAKGTQSVESGFVATALILGAMACVHLYKRYAAYQQKN